jgi:8-oxo-dGTP pyrophosphatase MutT (NUDIX family)
MREIQRKIASAIVFSKDRKILMGKKDPTKGGVYSDCWHIPGGGREEDETLEQTLLREVLEETGINISSYEIKFIPIINSGVAEKTLKTGERVLCHMEFNVFEVDINDKNADDIALNPTDDLVEMHWFDSEELKDVKQIPGGKEFFIKAGYIEKI